MIDHTSPSTTAYSDTTRRAVSETDAARYIGMSRSWLAQSRMTGNPDAPPYIKIGRSVRYLVSDLDAWLAERRFHAPTIPASKTASDASGGLEC